MFWSQPKALNAGRQFFFINNCAKGNNLIVFACETKNQMKTVQLIIKMRGPNVFCINLGSFKKKTNNYFPRWFLDKTSFNIPWHEISFYGEEKRLPAQCVSFLSFTHPKGKKGNKADSGSAECIGNKDFNWVIPSEMTQYYAASPKKCYCNSPSMVYFGTFAFLNLGC